MNSMNLHRTNVHITQEQGDWVDESDINFSEFVRGVVENER